MTMPVDRAPAAPRRLQAAPAEAAVRAKTPTARWVPGLLTASMAIALAVREPPPGLDEDAYFLALSLVFIAGVAGIMAAVSWVPKTTPAGRGGRRYAGSKLVYDCSVAALAVAASLSLASLLLLG
ncbi:unnamed protein product [Urochloa decumbens]|uniref:Uncharacterized protein n=1 Tax=Urochloa decumbens TaxID=240449 RepID=A0ABC8ZSM7_9POAL